jgi:3-phosphoshikimate 1-carboxyvinyltransferase
VAFSGYNGRRYAIEPDASAASYFFAAAAISGGRVRVEGIGRASKQGDVAFVEVLERMGAAVTWEDDAITVRGTGTLRGVDVDMRDISDTAQTLAAVAVFADSPTRITGIGYIRRKETDRIGNTVAELRKLGIEAREEADGFVVRPGSPMPGQIETYDDHRMAMSFALLGLRAQGIEIVDPDCVGKTFPVFWSTLDALR